MARVLETRRDDLGTARIAEVEDLALEQGQARFAVDRFGLTTNNVTYGLLGELLSYWSVFPCAEEAWGRVPAWGFAVAIESRCADVPDGTRIFGFVPMGGELVLTPQRIDERGLHDGSASRAGLPAAYNAYRRAEPSDRDDARMILQPLLATSVLLARALEGATRVVLSSASSKTALGTAYLLSRRGVDVSGITASADFVHALGVYAEVVRYEAIDGLTRGPATFADLTGDPRVLGAVHRHLGGELEASLLVGATRMADTLAPSSEPLPGPKPAFFFAPDHLRDGLDTDALSELLAWAASWLEIERRDGPDAVLGAWADAVGGILPPVTGLSLGLR